MMKKYIFIVLVFAVGLSAVELQSKLSFKQTVDNIKKSIEKNGYTIYASIDHKKNAKSVGAYSNRSVVVIFDNPKDTARVMMHDSQVAFDLPQKVMIYENLDDEVVVMYEKYDDLKKTYDVKNCMILDSITRKIDNTIKGAIK